MGWQTVPYRVRSSTRLCPKYENDSQYPAPRHLVSTLKLLHLVSTLLSVSVSKKPPPSTQKLETRCFKTDYDDVQGSPSKRWYTPHSNDFIPSSNRSATGDAGLRIAECWVWIKLCDDWGEKVTIKNIKSHHEAFGNLSGTAGGFWQDNRMGGGYAEWWTMNIEWWMIN